MVEIFAFVFSAKRMSRLAEKVARDSKVLASYSIHSFVLLKVPKHLSDRQCAAGLTFQTFSALPTPTTSRKAPSQVFRKGTPRDEM